MRRVHRWLSIVFTLAVIGTFIALQREAAPEWVTYVSLPPLLVLFLSGWYLFLQPYLRRWRGGRQQ